MYILFIFLKNTAKKIFKSLSGTTFTISLNEIPPLSNITPPFYILTPPPIPLKSVFIPLPYKNALLPFLCQKNVATLLTLPLSFF